jgi:hypothetical protein
MHQKLWGYKVEEKLYVGVREQKKLNTTGVDDDEYGALVEWYWQGQTQVLTEQPVPVPLCPPQISFRLTSDRTRLLPLTGWRLTV